MAQIKIKIIDEINIVVVGLLQNEIKYFYDKFAYYDKGYRFKPQFTLGKWDGKIRLFSEAGRTSIHFAEEIIKDLKSFGHTIKLIDKRNPISFDIPEIDNNHYESKGIILADHQVECINALTGNRGGIAVAATGAGKSYIIGSLFNLVEEHMNLRCLAIVPTTDLVLQTSAEIENFVSDVGMYYGKEKNLTAKHCVSTWQSLQNNPEIIGNYHCIIVDEAHSAKSNVLKNLITTYGSKAIFICGVTGTLPKERGEFEQVRYVLGSKVADVGGKQLIDLGWLAKLKINVVSTVEDLKEEYGRYVDKLQPGEIQLKYKQYKKMAFPDFASERKRIFATIPRNEFIADLISNTTSNEGNSFVLVNSVPYGRKLAKLIPNAIFIDGSDDTDVRKKVYSLFDEKNDVVVIATFRLASTGLNIKRIYNLFLLDPNKSYIEIVQSIGRGLRKAKDKDKVTVWDISCDFSFSTKHRKERIRYYKEHKYPYNEISFDY